MSWAAFLAALLRALEPYLPKLAVFVAGWEAEKGQQDAKELERVEAANRAAAGNRDVPFDERVQRLKQRGRVRGL